MPDASSHVDSRAESQVDSATDPHLEVLHTAVNCYLSTLLATANCVGAACPEVGGLYRHRLNRLRSRLAFDSSPAALEESSASVETELNEFASKASLYVAQHGVELRSAIGTLEEIVRSLAQRQDFYGARLRQFAAQMETAAYPTEPGQIQDVVALQVAGLLSCVESMSHETQSLVLRMRNELGAVEQRLQESEVTDPLTGLMNRREMERQIESRKKAGSPPVLLHFQLNGEVNAEVMQQVASRLGSQFRHKDFVCRWTDTDFLVLFQGPQEIAQMRVEQIVPWVAGRYLLESGESVQIGVDARLTEPELVA
jgi:GGDEF domain-containing protein